MMRIFISSISSYVGSFIASHYLSLGHHVFGTYRSQSSLSDFIKHHSNCKLLCLNFTHASHVGDVFSEVKFDLVINSTGAYPTQRMTNDDVVSANYKAAYLISTLSTRSPSYRPRLIVNFSSLSVYGDLKIDSINDSTLPSPTTLYGTSKLLSEQIIDSLITSLDTPILHLRFPVVLGYGAHRAWLPTLLDKMLLDEPISFTNPSSFYTACTTLESVLDLINHNLVNILDPGSYHCPLFSLPDLSIQAIFDILKSYTSYSRSPKILQTSSPCCSVSSDLSLFIGYNPPKTSSCIDYWLKNTHLSSNF